MVGEYKLKLIIDDSKIRELESRLGRSLGINQKNGLDSVFGDSGSAGKNLAKLGAIAAATGASLTVLDKIWKIGIESSGHAQATLKLWDTSMRLIFRPLGDTIGLVLRPFALMMIKWAVPFYRDFAQNFDTLLAGGEKLAEGNVTGAASDVGGVLIGSIFGENFAANWQSNMDELGAILEGIDNFFRDFNLIPMAYGDAGEAMDQTNNSLANLTGGFGFLEEVINAVKEEITARMTLPGLGITPGDDFTEASGMADARSRTTDSGGSKMLSRAEFANLKNILGTRGAMEYIRSAGFGVVDTINPSSSAGNRNASSGAERYGSNVTITVNGAVDSSTLDKIAQKVAEEQRRHYDKFTGRYN